MTNDEPKPFALSFLLSMKVVISSRGGSVAIRRILRVSK